MFSVVVKREPGANPGQTRCCKFHSKLFEYATSHCPQAGWEGIQRRNKSEDLPKITSF